MRTNTPWRHLEWFTSDLNQDGSSDGPWSVTHTHNLLTGPACVWRVGSGNALLAQTQHWEVSGRPAKLHSLPWRVDGGGPSSVWTGVQLPREELSPHPADGTFPVPPVWPVHSVSTAVLSPVSLCSYLIRPWPAWCASITPGRKVAVKQVWWTDRPENTRERETTGELQSGQVTQQATQQSCCLLSCRFLFLIVK